MQTSTTRYYNMLVEGYNSEYEYWIQYFYLLFYEYAD